MALNEDSGLFLRAFPLDLPRAACTLPTSFNSIERRIRTFEVCFRVPKTRTTNHLAIRFSSQRLLCGLDQVTFPNRNWADNILIPYFFLVGREAQFLLQASSYGVTYSLTYYRQGISLGPRKRERLTFVTRPFPLNEHDHHA